MARKPETNFRNNVVVPALKLIPRSYFFCIQQFAKVGDPDILMVINGRFVALELKSDEESVIRPIQIYKLEQVIKAGGVAFRVDRSNWNKVYTELLKLAQGGQLKWENKHDFAL